MLDMLEKLINEHGSSVILKERLQLFSDKYEVLEEKNKHLTEINEQLELQLSEARKEIERLRGDIYKYTKENNTEFNEIEIKILKNIFDTNQDHTASELSAQLSIEVGLIEYHLNNLLEAKYIHDHLNMISETSYSITPEGRKYIVEKNI